MLIKIHDSYRKVVAVCDSDLIGKIFEEGKMQLDVRENFFSGEEVSDEEAVKILETEKENYVTFNIVGKHAVKMALDAGVISEGNIGKVDDVPFALVF